MMIIIMTMMILIVVVVVVVVSARIKAFSLCQTFYLTSCQSKLCNQVSNLTINVTLAL